MMKSDRTTATHAVFPTTCWTAVLSLKNANSEEARNMAMAVLCETYWYPLYAFARHRGKSSHDAEDAVQGFFLSIVNADYLVKADHEKGKMRTFLLTGFTRYIKDIRIHSEAQKRGGGIPPISLNTGQAEEWLQADPHGSDSTPHLDFEKNWARSTIRAAVELLRRESLTSEKSATRFDVLSRFLNPETCHDFTHQQAAEALGISADACAKAIQRLRQSFRITVREQVASTLEHPDDASIMEEMLQLQKALVMP